MALLPKLVQFVMSVLEVGYHGKGYVYIWVKFVYIVIDDPSSVHHYLLYSYIEVVIIITSALVGKFVTVSNVMSNQMHMLCFL